MRAIIRPGTARGTVAAPPSKSMAHRLLICAALAQGESVVRGVDPSEDVLATADCLTALGASLSREGTSVRVRGCDPRKAGPAVLRCRESGSTLRFMIPLCLLSGSPVRLEGSETLLSRPLSVYEDLCREQGLILRREDGGLLAEGRLAPGEYAVPGGISSQFITGLLFALPLLSSGSRIRLIPPVESRSYLSLTLQSLRDAGISVSWADENMLIVPGNASYRPQDTEVEGDCSNAAFFEAFNCAGGSVTVTGLRADSLQGDRVYREYFRRLAAGPAELDLADCPDLAPVLFAAASLCHGAVFTGTRRLRFKESDRGAAMAQEMAKFGVNLVTEENRIAVPAAALHAPAEPADSHNDHRIAMALSLLCARTGGEIRGAEAVRKSFPDYWDKLRSLGIDLQLAD
ncbi:MAG: 3-phosphoshikimate 1-carboxyvinyltransferase [Clostridiales bacterium]|nr:3-phosphoshikimate 1-carboxyvinyltransferase [Clostridiales bacterium]